MKLFDRKKLKIKSLLERESKSKVENTMLNPDKFSPSGKSFESIVLLAQEILEAKKNNKAIIFVVGAHFIKNGLSLYLREMIKSGYVTHIATNGAGSIHDWENAFQGKTEEDVEKYISQGQFGIWDETGKYSHYAIISGAKKGKGYGESIGEMIHKECVEINGLFVKVNHKFKEYSVQDAAFANKIPFTVHPGYGYDIIYSHPACDGASIGKAADTDFLGFVNSVSDLEGGVFISIGSSVMSPMIFEKALSMARNVAHQENKQIKNFSVTINDIKGNTWDFKNSCEPKKNDPAYYDRLCKSFKRMGPRRLEYIQMDNREFVSHLYSALRKIDSSLK